MLIRSIANRCSLSHNQLKQQANNQCTTKPEQKSLKPQGTCTAESRVKVGKTYSLSHNQNVMSYLFCTDITISLWQSTLTQSQLHIFYEMNEVVGEWKCFVVEVLVPVDRAVWIQSEADLVSS